MDAKQSSGNAENSPRYDNANDGYWASCRLAEFNLWWRKMEIDGEGQRLLDYRLKDVPDISGLLSQILSWLIKDLEELRDLGQEKADIKDDDDTEVMLSEEQWDVGDIDWPADEVGLDGSDDSSLSFPSLPSSDKLDRDAQTDDETSKLQMRKLELKKKVADDIERLQGFTHWIEQAGTKHRRQRIELYKGKGDPKFVYEGYRTLASSKAKQMFPKASEIITERIAETFAERRMRFDYLAKHQKKQAVGIHLQDKQPLAVPRPMKKHDTPRTTEKPQAFETTKPSPSQRNIQDQQTAYSATVDTKLDPHYQLKPQQRAESVISVSVQHDGFPPPPRIETNIFQCPYCRLDFDCREAKGDRWKQHVMRDFEPYFCTFESCDAPFNVPQTFNGFLVHLHGHIPFLYHIDTPDGQHKELNEGEFDEQMKIDSSLADDTLHMIKATSLKRGTFAFTSCPFCGGYPDTIEKLHPDPSTFEAQVGMQKHIKHHMQEISLWLPPYREDISYKGSIESPVASRQQRLSQSRSDISEKHDFLCKREDCDCHTLGEYEEEYLKSGNEDRKEHIESLEDEDFWPDLINNPDIYDRSAISTGEMQDDKTLKEFILYQAPESTQEPVGPTQLPSQPPRKYTIGWICSTEMGHIAARQFLDEVHDIPESVSFRDKGFYTLGKIGKLNVAITSLPVGEYGTTSAARVAGSLLFLFTNIRICLLVSIGSGAPSPKHDIRLGDVVVSSPRGREGGVVQFGGRKTTQGVEYMPVGHLNKPPQIWRAALAGLRANHEIDGHQYHEIIDKILKQKPELRKKYNRPDPSSDKLYQSTFTHQGKDFSCTEVCGDDPSHLVVRQERDEDEDNPAVHYGLIASLNIILKDASIRDKIARDNDILCFEMEAAGLMNTLPCLAICGICDYADSHKNQEWQGYAAMTAAAYASELLSRIPSRLFEDETTIANDTLSAADIEASPINSTLSKKEDFEVLEWLTQIDYGPQHDDYRKRRVPGTGTWLLESAEYRNWWNTGSHTLFCWGIPGAGKTILTSMVIEDLTALSSTNSAIGLAYIYCSRSQRDELRVEDLLGSVLKQLSWRQSPLPESVLSLHAHHKIGTTKPSLYELSRCIEQAIEPFKKTFLVIDALDECKVWKELLACVFDLQANFQFKIFATARPNPDIIAKFIGPNLKIHAPDSDIRKYLNHCVSLTEKRILREKKEEIITGITEAVDGVFLQAQLYFDSIRGKLRLREIKDSLSRMRTGHYTISQLYDDAFKRIQDQSSAALKLAMDVLLGISRAKGQIRIWELQHEIGIEPGESEVDEENIPLADDMVSVCAGLVTIDTESQVIRFIHSTAAEYFERHPSIL